MPYHIYKITSPSGKCYIGLSKDVKARWLSHRRKARTGTGRHPFYDSLRSYGWENFTVETLSSHETLEAAKVAEIATIAQHRPGCYNVSDGGEYDAGTGGKIFWRVIKQDPERYAAYIEKLRAALKGKAGIPYHLLALNRALPAKERWKRQNRATRVAAKKPRSLNQIRTTGPKVLPQTLKEAFNRKTPAQKKRHALVSRDRAIKQWQERTPEERKQVAEKITSTLIQVYGEGTEARARLAAVAAKGRETMDRAVQGAAASKGLKKFWEDLKKDPVRYKEYMATRTASLMKTLAK
jgi:group I intron endonuclease